MTLTLEVFSSDVPADEAGGATVGPEGGTIGRQPGSTLVLSDRWVSGRHAVISYRNGAFYIEDKSRNGICLNAPSNRLQPGEPYPLESGDRLLIGPYEIRVSVLGDDAERRGPQYSPPEASERLEGARRAATPFEFDDPFAAKPPVRAPELENVGPEVSRDELDPLRQLFGDEDVQPAVRAPKRPRVEDLDKGFPVDQHFQPPRVSSPAPAAIPPGPAEIPEGYNPLESQIFGSPGAPVVPPAAPAPVPAAPSVPAPPAIERPAPAPAPSRRRSPAPPSPPLPEMPAPPPVEKPSAIAAGPSGAAAVDLGAVLAGAGLDPALATTELGHQLGEILRVVVAGVMDVMESRSAIKDELDVRRTRFKAVENNPLKFSANVDDALHNLLVKRNPAYLPPVAAFERAFADLRHHQVAMLAGIQAAFESVLGAFDPDRLQEEFDRQLGAGLVPAKMRYWDLYRDRVHALLKDMDTSYRELFAKAFARAYAEKLERLKAVDGGSEGQAPTGGPRPSEP